MCNKNIGCKWPKDKIFKSAPILTHPARAGEGFNLPNKQKSSNFLQVLFMIHIDVFPYPPPVLPCAGKTVVMIDVLRASSTIVTALANGCRAIIPVEDAEAAQAMKTRYPDALLCGERDGLKIRGFDLGNSPFEYESAKIAGKELILTTTNGTHAARLADDAGAVLVASFLNFQAMIEHLKSVEGEIIILCAGNDRQFSLEDALCGGLLAGHLYNEVQNCRLTDAAEWARHAANSLLGKAHPLSVEVIYPLLHQSEHGRKLFELHFENDIRHCARLNVFAQVPLLKQGKFII